ncbi:hypothetical protein EG327_011453 [Venturia inaequalis]|uniref:Protein kinase domain-containing protein n=1 Tax=Venturia inaequalis TaxID=5025 RepID=A0A8H3VTT6_VENIN|nr:hypothetical protein EG327_011453 [Venturia inaequalis]
MALLKGWARCVSNYPNTIVEYPYMYSLEGVALDAMLDGIHVNTTCAASVTSSTITLPSHPPLPTAATTGVPDDSKSDSLDVSTGMVACRNVVIGDLTIVPSSVTTTTIVPVWKKGDVPIEFYRSAFSDNRAFQKCKSSTGREVLGKITFVQAVQFLTETSTSYATGIGPIRTIKDPGTQATTAESAQSPTTTAKNVISSDALITASKIIASHALVSPIASTQAPQVNLGDNILPIRPTTLTASGDSDISPVLVPAFVIGTQTLALGTEAAVTIAGTPVAVRTSNGLTFVVVGDSAHASTIQLSLDPSKSTITPPPIIVGETTIAPSLQTTVPPLIISGQTLVPGEALILSGNFGAIVALATDTAGNSILVAGGKTTTLASRIQSLPIVLAGYTFAPQPASTGYIISGQTLTFGGSVAIQDASSTKIVLLTTNSVGQAVLISNGQTAMIPSLVPGPLTVDGITLSPILSSAVYEYHVSDKILTMGGTITIGTVPSQKILILSTNSAGQTIIVENGQTTTMISSMISTKTTTGAPSNIAIADVIGSVMGLSKPTIETSSTASVQMVLEVLGPSVPDLLDARCHGERLPGKLAKAIAKQALLGLDYLHQQKIGHGDLHTRNLAFTIPSIHSLSEDEFLQTLGNPETGLLRRVDGKPLEPGLPEYLVRPTSFPVDLSTSLHPIKIVDFGESFLGNDVPVMLHTPLPVRAPEIIFGEKFDYRVDLWSMGCMLFELVVGQPPFDSFLTTPTILVRQMLEMANDELPERWQQKWRAMDSAAPGERSGYTPQQWLEEIYFDGERNDDLTREDILNVGRLVRIVTAAIINQLYLAATSARYQVGFQK